MQLSDQQVKSLEFNDASILSIQNNEEGDVELEIEMEESGRRTATSGRLVFVAAYVLEPESGDHLIEDQFRGAFFRKNEGRGKIQKMDFIFDADEKQAHITFSKHNHGKGGEALHSLNVKYLAVKWVS